MTRAPRAAVARAKLLVLGGAAAFLILLRFADLSSAPFINDEPKLQLMLDQHLAARTLPRHGLEGTRGVAYGPTALWIYMPLRLLTDDVGWIIALHVCLHCLGLVLVFLAIRSSVGLETALWSTLLIASSPYLFFYARLAWDNTFLIPLTALTLFCLARLERGAGRVGTWAGLGLASGLVFNLHLMALPVIAAAALVVLPLAWRDRRSLRVRIGVVAAVAALALTIAPYLWVVGPSLHQGSQTQITGEAIAHAVPETLLGTGMYVSAAGMEYFLNGLMDSIAAHLRSLTLGIALAWVVRAVAWSWLGLSCFFACRAWARTRGIDTRALPIVAQFGVVYFVILLLYYYAVRPYPFHPHYFMSSFWLVPFFATWFATTGAARLTSRVRYARLLSYGVLGSIALIVISNVGFVFEAHRAIARRHGTRDVHYSSTRGELQNAMQRICELARARGRTHVVIDLNSVEGVLSSPFDWFSAHLPQCSGIAVDYRDPELQPPPEALAVRVSYANTRARDARLRVTAP